MDAVEPKTDKWPGASTAARLHGFSARQLRRFVEEGKVRTELASDGTRRYHPDDLAALVELGSKTADTPGEDALRIVLHNATDLLKQSHQHLEKSYAPAHAATLAVLDLLTRENARLSAQNAELVKSHTEVIRAREAALNEQHERELTSRVLEGQERRKSAALEVLKTKVLPMLAPAVAAAAPASSPSDQAARVQAATELFASIMQDQDQLELLLHTDLLREEQKSLLRVVLGIREAAE